MYAQLVRAVEQRGDTFQTVPEIAPYYQTQLEPPSMLSLDTTTETYLADGGHPGHSYVYVDVYNPGPTISAIKVPYQNSVHAEGKALHEQLQQSRPGF